MNALTDYVYLSFGYENIKAT